MRRDKRFDTRFGKNRLRAAASAAVAVAMGAAALTAMPSTASAAGDGLSVQYSTSATGSTADQSEP